jgi:hypothetical protein
MKSIVEPLCKHCIQETDCLGCHVYIEGMKAEQDFLEKHSIEELDDVVGS